MESLGSIRQVLRVLHQFIKRFAPLEELDNILLENVFNVLYGLLYLVRLVSLDEVKVFDTESRCTSSNSKVKTKRGKEKEEEE
mmetsp:Transcript_26112/g.43676  ORF Transcript_26112/g.43676 Transcript_26112/m.43676 type:complete len:83 (+) Transcript_26112:292-540(+)